MARRIVITSGKGGVGKTAVTAFLGAKLCELGRRVVLLDLDLGLNNLDVTVGVEGQVVYDIVDVLEGRCRARQALIQTSHKNLYMIPSSRTFNKNLSGQSVKLLIEGLSSEFDYVLIDCPAGIDHGFERAVSSANEALVVTNPTLQSVRDSDKVLTLLKSYGLESCFIVLNRVREDLLKKGKIMGSEAIQNALKTTVLGEIMESDELLLSSNVCLPHFSAVGRAFKKLAKAVNANPSNAQDYQAVYGGLFKSGGGN